MQEIFEFSQLLPAVVDLTKVFKFCQEFCQLGSFCSLHEDNTVRLIKNFLLECDVFLPSPNTDFCVELINNFSHQCHVFLLSLNINILVV